jgi:hypothetical protein
MVVEKTDKNSMIMSNQITEFMFYVLNGQTYFLLEFIGIL